MAGLSMFLTCSLDLRTADDAGGFDWAEPPEDVHAFVNDRERAVGTYLYGRRMWETMRFWETCPAEDSVMGDYAEGWRGADEVVHSRTLESVDTARSRLVRQLDPAAVRALKAESEADITIGGADLAGQALAAGLVDEVLLLLVPVVVGEGPRALPGGVRAALDLEEERTFRGGWVHLRYAVRAG